MSFFFDILTKDGFVLVSERRLQTVTNGAEKNETLRKIEINPEYPSADAVKCAIVVAGDDPCKALQFFKHACDKKDEGLRSVAR